MIIVVPSCTVADVMAALQARYPPAYAEDWDHIGLVCGDPAAAVSRVLFTVDVTDSTVAQAVETGAELLIAHHPLLLRGVHSVATSTPKGRLLHRLITSGIALYVAHTNADSAAPGVSDALAVAIGLDPATLTPLRPGVPAALVGLGRVGRLPTPLPLSAFAAQVAAALPPTPVGVRAAGDPNRIVERVAVCGGAGDSLLGDAAASGADVFVTADLRHHVVSEFLARSPDTPALIDAGHWATERPWLDHAARVLRTEFDELSIEISDLVTDPWTVKVP